MTCHQQVQKEIESSSLQRCQKSMGKKMNIVAASPQHCLIKVFSLFYQDLFNL